MSPWRSVRVVAVEEMSSMISDAAVPDVWVLFDRCASSLLDSPPQRRSS
jgi:hypothetical protein